MDVKKNTTGEKQIMTGNQAIARGAYEAGCMLAAAYPGTPSTEILQEIAAHYKNIDSRWSPNEKVALEVAAGASICGARALAAMKHVGLNVAADPLFTLGYTGVNGGLVIVNADDPNAHSSQNEQDNRLYAKQAKLALIEPSDSQECLDYIRMAYDISEQFDIPVLFRVTTRICHTKTPVVTGEHVAAPIKAYEKNIGKYIMAPANAQIRHGIVEKKLLELKEYSENSPINMTLHGNKAIGIITSGISFQYAMEVFGQEASYLKLGLTFPLPEKKIADFCNSVDRIIVIEEGEPYLENAVKRLGFKCTGKDVLPICGEFDTGVIEKAFFPERQKKVYSTGLAVPPRPPVLCAGCPHRGFFYELSKYKNIIASGDIGCYTLGMAKPLSALDTVVCMGASISLGIGLDRVCEIADRKMKTFAVIGDSTFFHSGITGLIDAVYNKSKIAVAILDNRTTGMTGHQENPGTGKTLNGDCTTVVSIDDIVRAVGVKSENIRVFDPYDLTATAKAIKEAYECDELFVIIAKRPCALIKSVQKERAALSCKLIPENCRSCNLCANIGCPAISNVGGTVEIDPRTCNGCKICMQVCKFNAIEEVI